MNKLQFWTSLAAAGTPVWIGDMRDGLRGDGEATCLILRLTRLDGGQRDFALPFAYPRSAQEQRMALDYGKAAINNLLAAWGGRRLEIFVQLDPLDARWGLLRQLLMELRAPGYDKPARVSTRLCAAEGLEPFSMELAPLSAWQPLPPEPRRDGGALAPRLRRAAEAAGKGLRCGLDVGGTDIKIVLSRDGELLLAEELDWNPALLETAEELMAPILKLVEESLEKAGGEDLRLDSLGLSFPDVVIRDRILGGETPKTRCMRMMHSPEAYEQELLRLSSLGQRLAAFCREGAQVRILNDGTMAAFSAAMELACAGEDQALSGGVFAHSLGTDLGSGWLRADGTVPPIPLELYDLMIDLGSWPQRSIPAGDLRSTCNENSGLPGARRYLGQAAAFRLAWERNPGLIGEETELQNGLIRVKTQPEDRRKPALEQLMRRAEEGDPAAEGVFRQIGVHLGRISREIQALLQPETKRRYLFGRFVRHPRCFALIREGCAAVAPELELQAADEELAASPLMQALAARGEGSVAHFGQAVGALYYGLFAGEEKA